MKNLHTLKAKEVSLVPKGANNKVFAVLKESESPGASVALPANVMAKIKNILKSFGKKPDEESGDGLSPQAQTALEAVGRIAAPHKDEITSDHVKAVLNEVGIQGGSDEGDGDVKAEHMKSAKEAAEKAYKETLSKLGYQKYPEGELTMKGKKKPMEDDEDEDADDGDDDEEGDDVGKEAKPILKEDGSINAEAVPAEMRPFVEIVAKQLTDSKAKADASEKRAEKLEKELLDNRVASRKAEIVAKAASFKNLNQVDTVLMLELADAGGKEKFDSVAKALEANDKAIGSSHLFGEIGSGRSNDGAGSSSDIMAKIEKSVEDVVQKSGGKVTKAQAMTEFLMSPEGQRLYSEEKNRRQLANPGSA